MLELLGKQCFLLEYIFFNTIISESIPLYEYFPMSLCSILFVIESIESIENTLYGVS